MPDANAQQQGQAGQQQQGQTQSQSQSQTPPEKGTPEYNKLMSERFEKQGQGGDPNAQNFTPAKAAKPDFVPDKFWDAEKGEVRLAEMAKSYGELEKTRGQAKGQQQQQGQAEGQQAEAGLDWEALGQKIATTGALEAADYAALEKAGVPRAFADAHVSLTNAAKDNARQVAYLHVGKGDAERGQKTIEDALAWAKGNLKADEIGFINAQLASKNWRPALESLIAKMDPTRDEPNLLTGNAGGGGEVGFASQYEMVEAMSKRNDRGQKLYEVDPAYRARVRTRVALMQSK